MGSIWDIPGTPNSNIPGFVQPLAIRREDVPQPTSIEAYCIYVQDFDEDISRVGLKNGRVKSAESLARVVKLTPRDDVCNSFYGQKM